MLAGNSISFEVGIRYAFLGSRETGDNALQR